jgi:hypothetical protein
MSLKKITLFLTFSFTTSGSKGSNHVCCNVFLWVNFKLFGAPKKTHLFAILQAVSLRFNHLPSAQDNFKVQRP